VVGSIRECSRRPITTNPYFAGESSEYNHEKITDIEMFSSPMVTA